MSDTLHPAYSVGSAVVEGERVPIRVDSGPFKGTLFSFEDMTVKESVDPENLDLQYNVDFKMFVHEGLTLERASEQVKIEFFETCSNPILQDILWIQAFKVLQNAE